MTGCPDGEQRSNQRNSQEFWANRKGDRNLSKSENEEKRKLLKYLRGTNSK